MVKGRPHAAVEPGFQLICPRVSVFIWHHVQGRIELRGGRIGISVTLAGSQFPSHCAFVNGRRVAFVRQGPMAALWNSHPADPTRVL
jgi:hypothetical protein